MRHTLFAIGIAVALPGHAFAAGIGIAMDEVRTMTFEKPVATVYVGNPAIADINMIDARHAFIIGKGVGSTNLVALDASGKPVSNTGIAVLAASNSPSVVTLNRGTQRVTYNCTTNHCDVAPQPGDQKDLFDQINAQISAHSDAAHKAATGR